MKLFSDEANDGIHKLDDKMLSLSPQENDEFNEVYIFGYFLGHYPFWFQLTVCIGGIFFFHCLYAYYQEMIFSKDGFPFGWYLTFCQFLLYSIFSCIELGCSKKVTRRSPIRNYAIVAFFMVATMGLSNVACSYLSYPTQVVFKSSKLIPVMIGGYLIFGKRYSVLECISALLIVIGLIIMTLNDVYIAPDFQPTGVFLIMGALFSDAFISNLQEKIMKDYDVSQPEMVFYAHIIGTIYLLLFLIFTGRLIPAMIYCNEHAYIYFHMMLFSFFGFCGMNFVLAVLKLFDAFIAMTVTSCRKVLTIILSFVLFPKPFTFQALVALLIVFSGISLHIYVKNPKSVRRYLAKLGISWDRSSSFEMSSPYTNGPL